MERSADFQEDIAPLFSYEEFKKKNATELEELYRKIFSVYFHNPSNLNSLNIKFNVESARSGFRVNQEMSKTNWITPGIDLFPELNGLTIPTLIIHGRQDIVPLWTAYEIQSAIKGSKIVVINNCGHFPYVECPDEMMLAIDNFVDSIQSTNSADFQKSSQK